MVYHGWWFQTSILFSIIYGYIWDVILPIDELHHFSEGWLNHQAVYHGLSISSGLTQTWIWLISPLDHPDIGIPEWQYTNPFNISTSFMGCQTDVQNETLATSSSLKRTRTSPSVSAESIDDVGYVPSHIPIKYLHQISPSNIPIKYPHQISPSISPWNPIECHQTIIFIHCSLSQLSQCQGSQRKQNSELWVVGHRTDGTGDGTHAMFIYLFIYLFLHPNENGKHMILATYSILYCIIYIYI